MKKQILLVLLGCIVSICSFSQKVIALEYFYDNATPYFGNGTPIPLNPTNDTTVSVNDTSATFRNLSEGIHHLFVRSLDDSGRWSITNNTLFYKVSPKQITAPNVTYLEYFIDTTVDFGKGIQIPFTASTDISNVSFTINDISTLSEGIHHLFVRSLDALGNWSITNNSLFYKVGIVNRPHLKHVEYFIDKDTLGFGNNTKLNVSSPYDDSISTTLDITKLSLGKHYLFARSLDDNGNWSITNVDSFVRSDAYPTIASFTPKAACPDSSATIFISGTNFKTPLSVSVGGKSVTAYKVNSPTSISAVVAPNSVGQVTVETQIGTDTSVGKFTNNNGYTPYAYVANKGYFNVYAINAVNNSITSTIDVGSNPYGVCISPDGKNVYISNLVDTTVSVINTVTNTTVTKIAVGTLPLGISITPDGAKVYVANNTDNTVSVINTATNKVIATIPVGKAPEGVCVSPDGNRVYITNNTDNTVSVINALSDTLVTSISVGNNPKGISVNQDGSKLYVANNTSNTVSVINTATKGVDATVPVGKAPFGITVSPDGLNVYVSNWTGNTVSVINTATNKVTATIKVGTNPAGISVSPDGTKVFVSNYTSGTLSVINTSTNKVTSNLTVGNSPVSLGNFIGNIPTDCGIPTPVTLLNIVATNKNGVNEVSWKTSTELNTSRFIVQHSSDGSSFTDIGTVKAIGSRANGYSFTDNNPANGINYYRLKNVDKDGSFTYSKVVSVINYGGKKEISVYHNPTKDYTTIGFGSASNKASILVYDIAGKAVITQNIKANTNSLKLNTGNLVNGIYVIEVRTETGSYEEKLVVNK